MKKGASTAIVMILVMLITVSLILILYQWLLKNAPETQQELEKNLGNKEGCLRIEDIDVNNNKITVRNCGDADLSNFVVYLDDKPIANYPGTLAAGVIAQISYTENINAGDHEVSVSSNYAESPKIAFYVSPIFFGICDVNITQSMIPYSITKSNTYYCLAENVNTSNRNAINFSSGVQNSILKCQGYSIVGNNASNTNGVYLTGSNINNAINNCNVTNFSTGIYLQNSNNNILINITTNSNNFGIVLNTSSNNTLTSITANLNTGQQSIWLISSSNNILTNVTASLDRYGIVLDTSSNNNILTNITTTSTTCGIDVYSDNNIFTNVNATFNGYNGMMLSYANNNTLTNINVSSTDGYGIDLFDSRNNTLTNITSNSNGQFGFRLNNFSNSTFTNIIANSNYLDGIDFVGSSNNTVANSAMSYNGAGAPNSDEPWGNGVNMSSGSTNNTFKNCMASYNHDAGFYTLSSSNNNSFINITCIDDGDCFDMNSDYNIVTNCMMKGVSKQPDTGMEIAGSNNIVSNSVISNSKNAGILLYSSVSGNRIYNNLFNNTNCPNVVFNSPSISHFFNTTKQTGTRIYGAGNQIGGNYWTNNVSAGYSDTCTDSDKDGFCDSPLNITNMVSCTPGVNCSSSTDFLPLSKQYQSVGCDYLIFNSNLPYNITQSNKIYCLAENVHIDGKNAINFSSGVQNSTLECLGYNIDGNDTSSTYGVYLTGSNTKNNNIKNCNITDFGYGIYLYNGANNNTVNNNIGSSNNRGIYIDSSNYTTITNNIFSDNNDGIYLQSGSSYSIITNNTANNNKNGIFGGITLGTNVNHNTLTNNTANSNNNGFYLCTCINNTLTNNTANNNTNIGIYFDIISNSILTNNIVNSNVYGFYLLSSSNNTITGGSIWNNTMSNDYYLSSAGTTNNFTNTNFTSARTIYFFDPSSWFNYANDTSGLWIKTNVSAQATITRKLINWNQTLMKWNDTSSVAVTATYNITGLLTNTNYNVVDNNNIITGSPFNSSSNGQINFMLSLSQNQEHDIRVVLACDTPSSGDWFIYEKKICNCLPGKNITVTGNVFVWGSGGLTLNNCLLWIKQTYDFQYTFVADNEATINLNNSVLNSPYQYNVQFYGDSKNNLTNTIINPPSTDSVIMFAGNSQSIITNSTMTTCTYFLGNSTKIINSSFTSDCNTVFGYQTKANITNSYVRYFLISSDFNHNLTVKDVTYGNPVSNYIKASGSDYEVNWTNVNIDFISFVTTMGNSNNTVINLKSNSYLYLYAGSTYVYNSSFSSFDSEFYSDAFLYTKNTTFSHPVNFYDYSTANITNSSLTDNITFYGSNSVFFDSSKTVDWNVKSSCNSIIRGNLTINGKLKWDAGGNVARYFPVIVTNSSGNPVSSASVNVTNLVSKQVIWQGLTDVSGYAETNSITFNSSNYGIGNFSINISKSGKVNSTIIGFLTNSPILLKLT